MRQAVADGILLAMTKPIPLLVVLAALLAAVLPPATVRAQFQVTEIDPPDGAELEVPPEFVHLCFSEAAIVDDDETFDFDYLLPTGRRLGLRIVFKADGSCVDVYPGLPDDYPAGDHAFSWRVTAAVSGEETSGSIRLNVLKAGEPGSTPALQESPTQTATPAARDSAGGSGGGDDGGPDLLLIAALIVAAVGGASVLAALFYLVRRRAGVRPPRDEGGQGSR